MSQQTPLDYCIKAALTGGKAAKECVSNNYENKEEIIGSQHAIVTDADFASNKAILEVLQNEENSLIVTEETLTMSELKEREVNEENYEKLKEGNAFIIDEIDGTSSYYISHYEWTISVGYVEKLSPIAGAIYAPDVFGGVLFYASKGEGAHMKTEGKDQKILVSKTELKDAYVIFGADCVLKDKYPKHFELIGKISDEIRTTNMNGSCALALSLVASGKADALIQPIQSVWDYAAGKVLVEEAGGMIQFYEMDDKGNCFPIEELELKHYNPSKRNVGFIAGNKTIVPLLIEKLVSLND